MAFGVPRIIDVEELKSKVSEFDILAHYFNVTSIPCFIHSPLRKDNRPSFGIHYKDNRVYWVDMATGERGGIYDLLGRLWCLNYYNVLNKIYNEIYVTKNKNKELCVNDYVHSSIAKISNTVNIEVKTREWAQYDIDYWNSYGISLEWLKFADVYPISHKIITKNGIKYTFAAEKYAYAYVEFKEGKTTIKIYQPLTKDKKNKWFNKHDKSVISLWTKIPESGENLCICSSVKDALCLWANIGIPCIATQGEGYTISDTAISELKRRFRHIYILFDNDEAGIKDGITLSEATEFTDLILPQFEGGKDVSDLFKLKGKEQFIKTIRKLFKILNYD